MCAYFLQPYMKKGKQMKLTDIMRLPWDRPKEVRRDLTPEEEKADIERFMKENNIQ